MNLRRPPGAPVWIVGLWVLLALGYRTAPAETTTTVAGPSLDEAAEALAAGRLGQAAESFDLLRASHPDDPRPLLGLAAVARAQGELLAALEQARRASEVAPDEAEAFFVSAQLLVELGAPAEALAALERVRQLEPEGHRGYLLAALVLRDVQRADAAIALLDGARGAGVEDSDLEQQRALLRLGADRVEEARSIARTAVEGDPDHAGLRLALGLALARGEGANPGQAREQLERALELGVPSPDRVRLELGTLLVAAGEATAALPHLEAAVAASGTPEAWYQLGLARRAEGDGEGARQALETFQRLSQERDAQEHGGKSLGTWLNEIQSLATANRLDEALAAVDDLLGKFPEEGRAHALKAKMLFSVGRIDGAIDSIVRARTLLPAYAEHHYLEGWFLIHRGRLAEAAEALERSLAIDPNLGRAHALLAGLAAEAGQLEAAAAGFERAFDLGLEDPAFQAVYDKVLERLGRSPANDGPG